MRDASIAVLREIGVETGGSNVQFAINPEDGRMVVIEMNPRVSRSSAPGLQGDRLSDRQDRGPARRRLHARRARQRHHRRRDAGRLRADDRLCRDQDPALRVREIPGRRAAPHHLDEVGRRGDGDRPHLRRIAAEGAALAGDRPDRPRRDRLRGASAQGDDKNAVRAALSAPTPDRLLKVRAGAAPRLTVERGRTRPARSTRGSSRQIEDIVAAEDEGAGGTACPQAAGGAPHAEGDGLFRRAARQARRQRARPRWRRCARRLGVRPVYKRIDTCAAEFASPTAYMYSTYETARRARPRSEARPSDRREGDHPRRRPEPHRPGHRVRLLLLPRRLRARATPATRRSWSTATRRRSRPTTTPPTGSISSR